jgi:protocatechuate 3,4-dioxygenase beta subunit
MRFVLTIMLAAAMLAVASAAAQAPSSCAATPPDMLGPFYKANAPERSKTGDGLTVKGAVRSTRGCKALPGAKLEWWGANASGEYDDAHRATQVTDGQGSYTYVTDTPGRYPGRPVHLHVKITAPGHKSLVTQVYPKPGQNSISFDFVLQPE